MLTKDTRQILATLEVVRESQYLFFRLRFSIVSVSLESGLQQYLQKKKRDLLFQLLISILKVCMNTLTNVFCAALSKVIFILRDLWLRMTSRSNI